MTKIRDLLATEAIDQKIVDCSPVVLGNMLSTLSSRIPGGSLNLRSNAASTMTVGEFADALDGVEFFLRMWSDRALAAEGDLHRLQNDVDAFRRILGTAS